MVLNKNKVSLFVIYYETNRILSVKSGGRRSMPEVLGDSIFTSDLQN